MSDWNSVGELAVHGIAVDGKQAALKALTAGVDMDMQGNLYITQLEKLVEEGKLSESLIDKAVSRVLRQKFALGLFENPYTDEAIARSVMLNPEHLDLARRAAEQSFVLLQNMPVAEKPVLPLDKEASIALIGPLADSQSDMLGNWTLRGKSEDVVTLRHALSEQIGDRVIYARGCDIMGNSEDDYREAIAAAEQADVVLMALGESAGMSGEAASRSQLGLPGKQRMLLKKIVATGKPVVLILFSGRPIALPWEVEHVPAILAAWFPGVQAGPALARTLFGEMNPSGKLTASFPRSVGQMPLYYNTLNTGRPTLGRDPGDGHMMGYRDQRSTALFPFGWGQSYTNFDYSPTRTSTRNISVEQLRRSGSIFVEATVKNSGERAGDEVVQLYIRRRGTSVAMPVRELKGFQKITLSPGETGKVSFILTGKDLAFWGIAMQHDIEPCELTVWIASHSNGGAPARINIAR